jgi:hypothetical protein
MGTKALKSQVCTYIKIKDTFPHARGAGLVTIVKIMHIPVFVMPGMT